MFFVGIVFLFFGGFFVYGSRWIVRIIGKNDQHTVVIIKTIGMIMTLLAFWLILSGEFPRTLEFIRIFSRQKGVLLCQRRI
ncbi:hypothetical protein [Geosporobacter ferrireducens]|uniref:Uncharacterized protein n=1 Tax=Geosporobacter ferrireducens TaxID=1424294 RepID=A0A1D8GD67_9FIRM|nr:hypothetical protein [Geosporobacter ferrireducens]AOT68850.1 hypothetical protein Gferi_04345 [Geosporobacter ferrireducens]MTI54917.1 hypothetical protein [Geosporobacter ferrireducens]